MAGIQRLLAAARTVEAQGEVDSLENEASAMRWLKRQVRMKKRQYHLADHDELPRDDWGMIALLMAIEQQEHIQHGRFFREDPWPEKNYEELILTLETRSHSLLLDKMKPNPFVVERFRKSCEEMFDMFQCSTFSSAEDEERCLREVECVIREWAICKEQNSVLERCLARGLL
jgi:hypothetical protein